MLIGRDDVTTNPDRRKLQDILTGSEGEKSSANEKPRIVVDHNPLGIKEAADNKIDLVLCGHTHKGQFFRQMSLQSLLMENRDITDIIRMEVPRALCPQEPGISKCLCA